MWVVVRAGVYTHGAIAAVSVLRVRALGSLSAAATD